MATWYVEHFIAVSKKHARFEFSYHSNLTSLNLSTPMTTSPAEAQYNVAAHYVIIEVI